MYSVEAGSSCPRVLVLSEIVILQLFSNAPEWRTHRSASKRPTASYRGSCRDRGRDHDPMHRSFRAGHISLDRSNPYPSEPGSNSYDGDLQRVGYGCSHRNLIVPAGQSATVVVAPSPTISAPGGGRLQGLTCRSRHGTLFPLCLAKSQLITVRIMPAVSTGRRNTLS
jgi:hypothetical protein